MKSIRWLMPSLLAASACYAQGPAPQFMQRGNQLASRPIAARTVGAGIAPAYADQGYPAGALAGGCANCNGGNATNIGAYGSGCGCGAPADPGFVGGCCEYLAPRARGVWNSYCSDRHHHMGGCGCKLGGCCNKVPIGMYGATPFGCCAAGVGFGRGCGCGASCGAAGGGISSCSAGCGGGCTSCVHGSTRSFGWRWGTAGFPCSAEASCGGETGCAAVNSGSVLQRPAVDDEIGPTPADDQGTAPAVDYSTAPPLPQAPAAAPRSAPAPAPAPAPMPPSELLPPKSDAPKPMPSKEQDKAARSIRGIRPVTFPGFNGAK